MVYNMIGQMVRKVGKNVDRQFDGQIVWFDTLRQELR